MYVANTPGSCESAQSIRVRDKRGTRLNPSQREGEWLPISELNQSTGDWYSQVCREAGQLAVTAIHLCQCSVVRFRFEGSLPSICRTLHRCNAQSLIHHRSQVIPLQQFPLLGSISRAARAESPRAVISPLILSPKPSLVRKARARAAHKG
jgi:hypothetical protein